MKILFLVPSLQSGGAERTITYLSSYLAKNGFDTTIVSISDGVFYALDENVHMKTLHVKSQSANIIERLYLIIKRFVRVNYFLTKNNFEVVFCMLPETAKYILRLKKRKAFKLITSERNNPAIVTDKKHIKLKEKIYKQSDGIVFQTQRAMDFYHDDIRKKGVVIHNAVGNEYVHQVPAQVDRKKKISAIGRLAPQKDYPVLFNAFKIVLDKHPEYMLEIFGNGADKQKLENLAQSMGISKNICFMGIQQDAILRAADSACYVMSSKFEGMPNALMEAMAVGLPCVSTDCPNGPAELIVNGENGLLVPVGDYDGLAEAILKMIEDRDFAEACGKNAKKILETHSVEIKAKEYLNYMLQVYNREKR